MTKWSKPVMTTLVEPGNDGDEAER